MLMIVFEKFTSSSLFACLCLCLTPSLPASLDFLVIDLGLDFGLLFELFLHFEHGFDPDYSLNVACLESRLPLDHSVFLITQITYLLCLARTCLGVVTRHYSTVNTTWGNRVPVAPLA